MQTQTPESPAATAAAMTEMLAAQQARHASLADAERLRAQARQRQAVDQAKLDTAEMMRRAAGATYAQGAYPIALLENDPYRDTRATLIEVRSNFLALKLSVDAVDMTYDVDGFIKGRYSVRRVSRHFDELGWAHVFFEDVYSRFFRIADFKTLVDF